MHNVNSTKFVSNPSHETIMIQSIDVLFMCSRFKLEMIIKKYSATHDTKND